MKISINTIQKLNQRYDSAGDPAPNGVDDLISKIGVQLGAVEEVIAYDKRFEGAIIVKVVEVKDHPDADRLHICIVDDGGKQSNVERDEHGYVQIVCGAPNVRSNMLAVWLPPGMTVPATFDQAEPFIMEVRSIRNQKSNGMLASPKELTISDAHEGILEITDDKAPGSSFADAYNLTDDTVLDLENKMFTHRPDCFGWIGVAREFAGIYNLPYKSPDWYIHEPAGPEELKNPLPLEIENEIPELVPRFVAVVLSDIKIGPSPIQTQTDLARVGIRPINNVVDMTNIYMLMTGQPIHAYDYDKVKALSSDQVPKLVIRKPSDGETITLLNGKTIKPFYDAMMVATDKQLICVGGAMGGADTEIDESTTNIILEAANWDMYVMRKTAMHNGIFTDAVTRFTKGQSPLQNVRVLTKLSRDICELTDAKIASPMIDNNHLGEEIMKRGNIHPPVVLSSRFINDRLGIELSAEDMSKLLTNVEFKVNINQDELSIESPFWRTDIAIPEDIVEEVGRLYGYDHLPTDLPKRSLSPALKSAAFEKYDFIRDQLSSYGANEVLSYSFVHGKLLQNTGQDQTQAFQLSNALSPDLQYYRLSLIPGLLDKIHMNIKTKHSQFALFEINKVHNKNDVDQDGLPMESSRLALVFAADDKTAVYYDGAPYYQANLYLRNLMGKYGLKDKVSFRQLDSLSTDSPPSLVQMCKPFEPNRSSLVVAGSNIIGVVGEFRQSVAKILKLPAFCSGFEILLDYLNSNNQSTYLALPRFPSVDQDICLRVKASASYQSLFDCLWKSLNRDYPDKRQFELTPVDIFKREHDDEFKQITFRLSMASYERTLTDSEVAKLLDELALAASDQVDAVRV